MSGCSSLQRKTNPKAAYINTKLAMLYLEQGQVETAKRKLLLAYKQAPDDPVVHNGFGYFFSYTGELEQAKNYYLLAIKTSNNHGRFCHNYGKFLYRQGDYEKSLDYFLYAAKDAIYLYTAYAYADASSAAKMLNRKELAAKYRSRAIKHGFSF